MNHGTDLGWKTVLFTGEALMAAALAGGVALLLALAPRTVTPATTCPPAHSSGKIRTRAL